MACLVAHLHDPNIDLRKPFTPLGDSDVFAGRDYDQDFISPFVTIHKLPVNPTTAFLTPGYRTNPIALYRGAKLTGRPQQLYDTVVSLLNDVYEKKVLANEVLAETIRQLILLKEENQQRMASLLTNLEAVKQNTALSVESIINLIQSHLSFPNSSRLPVLVIAAAYNAAQDKLGERCRPLQQHTAADKQTGALGDIEITLQDDNNIVTAYEMKAKRVTVEDIHIALQKLERGSLTVDNYIFITTENIDPEADKEAKSLHSKIGVEFTILDCIGFLRHFLYLFYRLRLAFLDAYQELVLNEPISAVKPLLKEAFLTARLAAEANAIQTNDE